jgi:hypothetical protein
MLWYSNELKNLEENLNISRKNSKKHLRRRVFFLIKKQLNAIVRCHICTKVKINNNPGSIFLNKLKCRSTCNEYQNLASN